MTRATHIHVSSGPKYVCTAVPSCPRWVADPARHAETVVYVGRDSYAI